MDDFVSKIKETATKAVGEAERLTAVALEKTGDVVNKTKVNYAISSNETKIKKIFTEVGKLVYDEYKDGAEFSEEIVEKLKTAEEFYKENEELRAKLCDEKKCVICGECGACNNEENAYCSSCGTKLK